MVKKFIYEICNKTNFIILMEKNLFEKFKIDEKKSNIFIFIKKNFFFMYKCMKKNLSSINID